MSLSVIKNESVKIAKDQSLTPTLIIGLGGSGKRVITELRKMFYEKYKTPTIPIVDYLYFDTDTGDITGGTTKIDAIAELEKKDVIDATISTDVFDGIINTFEGKYPHIAKWFDKESIIPKVQSSGIQNGAKQIRPIGKLTFFHKYSEFKNKIKSKIKNINGDDARKQTENLFSKRNNITPKIEESNVELIVVGSIAGGTGSGTFIDAGFASKYWAKKETGSKTSINTTGIFFLPSTFSNISNIDMKKANANGYAALKELNYYLSPYLNSKKNEYSMEFEWEREEKIIMSDPVYNVAYLLENKTTKGIGLSDVKASDDVFKMASEFLFLDFNESSFSTKKRSLHSNDNAELGNITKNEFKNSGYIETFSNRFSSFGLSQIKMNIDKIRSAAQYKFTGDMLKKLIKENRLRDNWFNDQTDWRALKLDDKEIVESMVYEFDKTVKNILNNGNKDENIIGIEELEQELFNFQLPEDIDDLTNELNGFVKKVNNLIDYVNKYIDEQFNDGNVKSFGALATKLNEKLKIYEKDVTIKLKEKIYDYLLDYEHDGVKYAEEFISILANHLNRLLSKFEEYQRINISRPKLLERNTFNGNNDEYNKVKENYDEAKSLFFLPPGFKGAAKTYYYKKLKKVKIDFYASTKTNFNNIVIEKQKEIVTYIENIIKTKISEKIINLLKKLLDDIVEEEKIKINNYKETLKEASLDLEKWFKEYTTTTNSGRNLELSLGWSEKKYEKMINKNMNADDYDTLLLDKITEFFKTDNLFSISENRLKDKFITIQDILNRTKKYKKNIKDDWNKLSDSWNRFTSNMFEKFKVSTEIDNVVDLFDSTYSDEQEKDKIINRLLNFSEPRLQTNPNENFVKNIRKISLLGIDKKNSSTDKNKSGLIGSIKKSGEDFTFEEFSQDTIIFYKEMIAYPVGILGEIEEMKNDYDSLDRQEINNKYLRYLEKDMDKYPDIIFCKTDKEAKEKIERLQPFLLSLMIGKSEKEGVIFDKNENSFFLLREGRQGMEKKRLRSDFNRSFFELKDKEKNELNEEIDLNGGRLFNKWLKKDDDSGIEKFFQLYITIKNLSETTYSKDEDQLGMLPKTLNSLADKLQFKLLKEVYQLSDSQLEKYKNDDISPKRLKEESESFNNFSKKREELESKLDIFSEEIDYYEKSIGKKLRILR